MITNWASGKLLAQHAHERNRSTLAHVGTAGLTEVRSRTCSLASENLRATDSTAGCIPTRRSWRLGFETHASNHSAGPSHRVDFTSDSVRLPAASQVGGMRTETFTAVYPGSMHVAGTPR